MKILNLLIVVSLSLIQFSCQNNSYNELAEDIEKLHWLKWKRCVCKIQPLFSVTKISGR